MLTRGGLCQQVSDCLDNLFGLHEGRRDLLPRGGREQRDQVGQGDDLRVRIQDRAPMAHVRKARERAQEVLLPAPADRGLVPHLYLLPPRRLGLLPRPGLRGLGGGPPRRPCHLPPGEGVLHLLTDGRLGVGFRLVPVGHAPGDALQHRRRGQVDQDLLELFAYRHNHRRFVRGKRVDKAPIEILTGKELEQTWLDALLETA